MQTQSKSQSSLERLQLLLPEVFTPQAKSGELFLRFQLGDGCNVAISLERIVSTLRLSAQSLTPMPNMPACTLGLMENQGKVFWVVDLAQALGLTGGMGHTREYEIIIVEALPLDNSSMASHGASGELLLLGLAVTKIRSTLRLSSDELKAATDETTLPPLQPYVQGRFLRDGEQTLVLSVDALSNARGLYGD